MEVETFAELEPEFTERIQKMVWCSMATVDGQGRPRSRVIHPLWEGLTGWITTRRHSFKGQHLARNPYISLAYVADPIKPVYVDCLAAWADDPADKQRVWDLCLQTAPPLGFDPAPIYKSVDDPGFGVLRLTPWRIQLADGMPPFTPKVWRAKEG